MITNNATKAHPSILRTGGQILVDQLRIHGIRHVFCVPGESYLAVLDALHDADIEVTICRQEGGAMMMAEAHGKLTGQLAACFVTRGPGATNATPGIHIASHDSTPVLVFVGQIERAVRERGALQELDYRAAFGHMAKWVTEIDDARRIPEIVSRAVHTATSGRPGPVLIALPEDMLVDRVACADAKPVQEVQAHPGVGQMARVRELLAQSERPLVVLGGTRWSAEAVEQFARWAKASDLPVTVSLRRQMLFPTSNSSFVGDLGFGANPQLVEQVKRADLILLLGSRLSETPSQGYTLLNIPVPEQTLIHVFPEAGEIGRVYAPTLGVCATPAAFVEALDKDPLPALEARSVYCRNLRSIYERWSSTDGVVTPGKLQMAQVMDYLNRVLPPDAIVCNGAGNYATWVHRFYRFDRFGTQLAPTSGSMGYGVPAAVGAKRVQPDKTVVAFAGDGCFLMNGQEFATAVQYQLPVIVVVVDNGMYGTIRMHQEREYPGRVSATELRNPDFAAYARAFGGHGERVETTEEFAPAYERALASGLPAILHCVIDSEAISPAFTLTQVREAAIAAGRGSA
ncbi:thiamine pyrophosphate-binding protein [Acidovorax carolinensis]|uniref:thiamine pyrophosphate-binding protein n=1 Tax=Acidovorax carolinensis TaxID=553814 RepID=UPI000B341EA2|nr:thiamine pyrophosphate-binding protein [Acidovorax carolinensis]ART49556.1 thiamine pyrophosphate-binding protein [Acidovorax carolinensis]